MMKVLDDSIAWLAAHSGHFFRMGEPNGYELANHLWSDALLAGATRVATFHDQNLWAVAAGPEWLTHESLSATELFTRMVKHPAAGPNSIRSEALVNAFCESVHAEVAGTVVFKRNSDLLQAMVTDIKTRLPEASSIVAFSLGIGIGEKPAHS